MDTQEGPRSEPESTIGSDIPLIEHNLYRKNLGNTSSLRTAVNAMCAHCMGCTADHMEPGYKIEIRKCSSSNCPLFHFRPYQS